MSQNASKKSVAISYREEREPVVLKSHGQKIFGILHRPLHLTEYPAILLCHGLGGHKVGRYRAYVDLSRRLAAKGIAVFRIDFRGSGDSEGEFSEMTLESEVSDACAALSYLENHPEVDKNRIGIFGRSMGSCISVMAANRNKRIKSICLWAPIYHADDWRDKWNQLHAKGLDESQKQELMTIEGQVPGYEFYKQLFSMNLENDIANLNHLPMMIIHGSQDNMVKTDHSEEILKKRLQASGQTKFIQLPNSDHHFSDLEEREIALAETCSWYEETL